MGQIFDFSEIEKNEKVIRKTWGEFRDALEKGLFSYDEVENAKKCTFLRVYDDLFNQNSGMEHKTVMIKEIKNMLIGRGTILDVKENPDYDRFIPKKEFIKEDNRFSPLGIEWLYLAIGEKDSIHRCAQAECRAKSGDRFGFCYFKFDEKYDEFKLVDLTIADDVSYDELNQRLEAYGQKQVKKGIKKAKVLGYISRNIVDEKEFKKLFKQWFVYTYSKLLSEQIFEPLDNTDDKSIVYAPFQTMAQYYISLGYSGIVYGSTVCDEGKNIVLFDKNMAFPMGLIEDITIL